jgi:hypothetical protein
MLGAYFDDSGTHGSSEIVLLAGIAGTEWELTSLECAWRKHLNSPLDGQKPRLKRFHMTECQNSLGEFTGWSRTETDYFCHQLQTEIIESGVYGYGYACSRKDWNELITGDHRKILGDAEGSCAWNCFLRASGWAQCNTFDPTMTFVFDNRPHREREIKVYFDVFQRWVDPPPELVGIAFLNSYDVVPLQAADMIAWELYQHANDILKFGFQEPRRAQFRRLISSMKLDAQIARRERIEMIVKNLKKRDPDQLRRMANHFTFFDPDNPDWSYLSGTQPS